MTDDWIMWILILIVVIIVVVVEIIFWYVAIPVTILVAYIYYRDKEGFPNKKYIKIKDKFKNYSARKIEESKQEANKFENLIKNSKILTKKTKKLISKEYYKPAVNNWIEAINYYNRAIEKTTEHDEKELNILRENIYNSYIDFISKNCLIIKEFSFIIQDNKIITNPILGLNVFLSYWLEKYGDEKDG